MRLIKYLSAVILIFSLCIMVSACHTKKYTDQNNNLNHNQNPAILATTDDKSNAKNQVWAGTFQLVWNDLTDDIIKHPVKFVNYHSDIADNLNKKGFSAKDISENAYYKKWGLVSPDLKTEIENGIKEKFNEKSDILDNFDWTPAEDKYLLYAMLKKDFEFSEKFNKLKDDKFNGSTGNVKYFGTDKDASYKQRHSVKILFYNNPQDFAVMLTSKQGDNVYLYRTNDDKTFTEYYKDMNKKTDKNLEYLGEKDEFKAPMLDFNTKRTFTEFSNKPIEKSSLIISDAIETIKFKMDETGVKLKSEAAIMLEKSCIVQEPIKPRYFFFNDKYIIFISENNKKPYFAMKISDAESLQK